MEKLISDLLYFSRIGRDNLVINNTDLNLIIDDLQETMADTFKNTNTALHIEKTLPAVSCDTVRMTEVFRNLITNAIKYNKSEEKIINVGVKEDGKTFYVRDNGIGIKKEFHKNVFRIFKRLNSDEEFGEGSGSGLTFVKKIIEQHNGKIWVESEEGQGTSFCFTLNIHRAVSNEDNSSTETKEVA